MRHKMVIPKLLNFYYHNQVLISTAKIFEYNNQSSHLNLIISLDFTFQSFAELKSQFIFHTTALDKAKENGHQEIATLLSNDLIISLYQQNQQNINKLNSKIKEQNNVISKLNSDNSNLKNENSRLKSFLSAFKEKPVKLDSFHFNEYEESLVIGEGKASTVKEVSKIRQEKLAKKELKLFDHKSLQRFLKESEILVQLRHPCIVRIVGFDFGDSTHPPSIFLSLEPSSLEKSIQKHELTNEDKNRITVEIVLGMRYIHFNNLIHRNLKPSNILLSQNKHVRISDFGLAKEEDLETSQSKGIGSLLFMAPELAEEEEENEEQERYANKVDVYSFGIILIYIVSEQYPKYNLKKKLNGILPTLPSTIVPWVVELISRCLQLSPNDRPTFNDIFEVLKSHDFDLFNETKPSKPTIQQRKSKEEIEQRILKIEAFEYQHRL